MNRNPNKIFEGDTLPENPKEYFAFEDIVDRLNSEAEKKDAYIKELEKKIEEKNVVLGEFLELISKGEANARDYEFVSNIKDLITSSKFHISEAVLDQNRIRILLDEIHEIKNEENKKLTTLKDEQKN